MPFPEPSGPEHSGPHHSSPELSRTKVSGLELYGSTHCQYTMELRDSLEWAGKDFHEYNVDADPEAFARMQAMSGGAVPLLVENGKVVQIGWQGRSCFLGVAAPPVSPPPR